MRRELTCSVNIQPSQLAPNISACSGLETQIYKIENNTRASAYDEGIKRVDYLNLEDASQSRIRHSFLVKFIYLACKVAVRLFWLIIILYPVIAIGLSVYMKML